MQKRFSRPLYSLFAAIAFLGSSAWAASLDGARDLIKQRQDFLTAKVALNAGQAKDFQALLSKLKNYPLYPYLRYEDLRSRLTEAKDKEVLEFLERYSDSPLSNRLRTAWLYELTRSARWGLFMEVYRESDDDLRCIYLQARLQHTKKPKTAFEDIKRAWLTGKPQPAVCDAVFERWYTLGGMSEELAWQRIRLAFEARQVSLAQGLTRYLNTDGKNWVDLWVKVHNEPVASMGVVELQQDSERVRELLCYGAKRVARFDVEVAHDLWKDLKTRYAFTPEDVNDVDREIALQAASKQHARALEFLEEVPVPDITVAVARARAAIARQQWPAVLAAVRALPGSESAKDIWTYWMARAMKEVGVAEGEMAYEGVAFEYFDQLAARRGFYGFLAADRLNRPYDFEVSGVQFTDSDLTAVTALPGIQRAYELYFLGLVIEARREWQFITSRLTAQQLPLAAVVAHRWGWHDRAIFTLAQTAEIEDMNVRFPLAYLDQVSTAARLYNLEPAWIYGVLRQESAFMADVRSNKGALGLMQLMPETARATAHSVRMPFSGSGDLLDERRNIQLGSAYLRQVLDQMHGHHVLATASYNAGPSRVKSWLPKVTMPADVWVEMVPFSETREYVKKVLAFTTIFEQRLNGKVVPMSSRMPHVPALNP